MASKIIKKKQKAVAEEFDEVLSKLVARTGTAKLTATVKSSSKQVNAKLSNPTITGKNKKAMGEVPPLLPVSSISESKKSTESVVSDSGLPTAANNASSSSSSISSNESGDNSLHSGKSGEAEGELEAPDRGISISGIGLYPHDPKAVALCDIQDWQKIGRKNDIDGVLVQRPLDLAIQERFRATGVVLGAHSSFAEDKEVRICLKREDLEASLSKGPGAVGAVFRAAVEQLLASLSKRSNSESSAGVSSEAKETNPLPQDLRALIIEDAAAIGGQIVGMMPKATLFGIALGLFGENVCAKWHVDNYFGRAIVTYNGNGTEYTSRSNVDWWELQNCGKCDSLILDHSKTSQVGVGDILFMKGKSFEGSRGLVHKSPVPVYDAAGKVLDRVILKVDARSNESESESESESENESESESGSERGSERSESEGGSWGNDDEGDDQSASESSDSNVLNVDDNVRAKWLDISSHVLFHDGDEDISVSRTNVRM